MNKDKIIDFFIFNLLEPTLGFFCVVLPFIFAGLQLFGVINWSWWIIFSPTILLCLFGLYSMVDLPRLTKKMEKEQQDFLNDLKYYESDQFKEDVRREFLKNKREQRLKKLEKIKNGENKNK